MKLIGPPLEAEQELLKKLKGKRLWDDQVELLEAPKWDGDKWVALANAFGELCFVEVSLSTDLTRAVGEKE